MSNQVYGPLTLTSGKVVTFRKPLRADRTQATIQTDFEGVAYGIAMMQVDELIKANCLETVDGNTPPLNPRDRFNDWEDQDVEFYGLVFDNMFGITKEVKDNAEKQAAFLLQNLNSTNGSNSTVE